ncbi:2-hydroxychromene-2-carboxylate isomerase [Amycolatopsis suaedae]|uniref:2-hydroxychromene-2-carboxylate isomerase n=1 Tax=Amycolatopsis suaedae TaxID=2510978 RepID=A0A4Q7J2G0_9PSEU|nr:DsbA family protein [Amycolatopsis suaedae]RZQ61089.1 disulfide bond formation protein DsbA [Amycolatopsis suaedae]
MTRRPPRLYFSLRSPYSWLAVTALRHRVPGALDEIECLPYWDPDDRTDAALTARGGEFHYVQMSRAKHLYMLSDTKRVAQRHGLRMAWPVDVDPWWELPHLAWLRARREGRAWQFYDALTEARWGRGEDICVPEVVRAAAEQAGVDPDLAVTAADDPDIREEGVECLYQAYLDDIFGIPYLKWGRHRFWGYDRLDAFLDVWRPDRPEPGPVPALATTTRTVAFDIDAPGGCG